MAPQNASGVDASAGKGTILLLNDYKEILPAPVQPLLRSEYFLLLPIHSVGIPFGCMLLDQRNTDHFGNSLGSLGDHIGRSLRLMDKNE